MNGTKPGIRMVMSFTEQGCDIMKKYITRKQIAEKFGVTSVTVQSWVREFNIPYYSQGDSYVLPPNGLKLLEPFIFMSASQRSRLATKRKMKKHACKVPLRSLR